MWFYFVSHSEFFLVAGELSPFIFLVSFFFHFFLPLLTWDLETPLPFSGVISERGLHGDLPAP